MRFTFGVVSGHRFLPDRREPFMRLLDQLSGLSVVVEDDRGTPGQWAERVWTKTYQRSEGRGWCVFLNDDVILFPHWGVSLVRLAEHYPGDVVCLRDFHPHARRAYLAGAHVLSTDDGLNGNAYAIPAPLMPGMLRFMRESIRPELRWGPGEDSRVGVWAQCEGRRILQPLPSLTDHDLTIPSAYGNDGHDFRRPMVTDDSRPWEPGPVADVGPVYRAGHWWLRTWLTPNAVRKYQAIDLMYAAAARAKAVYPSLEA